MLKCREMESWSIKVVKLKCFSIKYTYTYILTRGVIEYYKTCWTFTHSNVCYTQNIHRKIFRCNQSYWSCVIWDIYLTKLTFGIFGCISKYKIVPKNWINFWGGYSMPFKWTLIPCKWTCFMPSTNNVTEMNMYRMAFKVVLVFYIWKRKIGRTVSSLIKHGAAFGIRLDAKCPFRFILSRRYRL